MNLADTVDKKIETQPKDVSLLPVIVIVIMFIISIGFALALAPVYIEMELQADFNELGLGDEESLLIPIFYVAIILIFTAVILFITRKRRGKFIKYAFLAVICLSMMYVFWAIFNHVFFPVPSQSWSAEVEVEGGVSTILIKNLLGDTEPEIIVGSSDGIIRIYDNDRELLWLAGEPLPGTITDLAVVDLDRNAQLELIIISGNITIFTHVPNTSQVDIHKVWVSPENDYTSLAVIPNYPLGNNESLNNGEAVIVGSSIKGARTTGNLEVISYYNHTYQLDPLTTLDFPVNSLTYGKFNYTKTVELYLGTVDGIYSIGDPINPTPLREIASNLGNLIGLDILDIDENGTNELIAWDKAGTIYIYEANQPEPQLRWKQTVGKHIGGVVFDNVSVKLNNIFKNFDGNEMVVSVDGSVYIYYTDTDKDILDTDKDILNERYEFTEETGRLNSDATGLAIGDLDDNDDLDIVVGYNNGFNQYQQQYIPRIYSDIPCFMGLIVSVLLSVLLFYHPEWYLVDIVGIIVAGGVTALIGISIGLLPLLILLIILAIYDAISVYKTKHMVSLADKVMEFKLPILLVVPKKRGYSFLRQKGLRKQLEEGEEREAMFIGLGDIIIPGTLVISAFHFLPATGGWFGLSADLLVAIFTLVGTLVGFSALMHFVLKGNPQAGLPLLNTGAILGFFISNFILYQDLTFGLTLPFG